MSRPKYRTEWDARSQCFRIREGNRKQKRLPGKFSTQEAADARIAELEQPAPPNEPQSNEAPPSGVPPQPGMSWDPKRQRWRLRSTGGRRQRFGSFRNQADAAAAIVSLAILSPAIGMTLRQWGEVFLLARRTGKDVHGNPVRWTRQVRSWSPEASTWYAVICEAHFIDWPLSEIKRSDILDWVEKLVGTKKKRSELRNGKRRTVVLDELISRTYAKAVLNVLRQAFAAAIDHNPPLISENPCGPGRRGAREASIHDVRIPENHFVNKKKVDDLDYLEQHQVEMVLRCKTCELERGGEPDDPTLLIDCPHMRFEPRVALAGEIQQCPRQGEMCSMRWEWIDQWVLDDRTGKPIPSRWKIVQSWGGATKNREERAQWIIPHFGRLLATWWELKGKPLAGLIFPAHRDRPLGPVSRFIEAHPDYDNATMLREAKRAGLKLSRRYLEVARSKARARADRKALPEKRYAKGYDFGWADHPFRDRDDVLQVRPGIARRLGIEDPTVFHEFRDTTATHLLSGTWGPRWSIEEVSKHLGHKDVKVTQERYAHLTAELKARAVAELDPLAAPALKSATMSIADAAATALPPEPPTGPGGAVGTPSPLPSPPTPTGAELSTRYHFAPEPGLEPGTTRLTAHPAVSDSAELTPKMGPAGAVWGPPAEPPLGGPFLPNHREVSAREALARAAAAAQKVLQAAASGAPLTAAALALAGAVLEEAGEASPAAERPGTSAATAPPRLRVIKGKDR